MITVGLIQLTDKHTEIIGGVVTMLLRPGVETIRIYTPKYKSSFIPYYKHLFRYQKRVKWTYIDSLITGRSKHPYGKLEDRIVKQCDKYIFLTGVEYEDMELPPDDTLVLFHHVDEVRESDWFDVCGEISISPVFKKEKVPYYLNVFKERKLKPSGKKLDLLVAGLTNPDNKDLKTLLGVLKQIDKNGNKLGGRGVCFHVINYWDISDDFKPYEDSGLIKVYIDTPADKMMSLLRKISYTLVIAKKRSSYHTKQLSGIIPLSLSCGVPLVCDSDIAGIYKISKACVTYRFDTRDYLYKALKRAERKDITEMKEKVILVRDKIIHHNKKAHIPCI
jgi:hypothetical protein